MISESHVVGFHLCSDVLAMFLTCSCVDSVSRYTCVVCVCLVFMFGVFGFGVSCGFVESVDSVRRIRNASLRINDFV